MSPTKFAAVVAVTDEWGIGKDSNLPWHPKRLYLDMAFLKFVSTHRYILHGTDKVVSFSKSLTKNAVVMGRKTWDSIPPRFRPMDGRINIIITSNVEDFNSKLGGSTEDVHAVNSFSDAIEIASQESGQIYVLGGASVYEAALKDSRCEAVFITRLKSHPPMPCNVFFPGDLLKGSFAGCASITNLIHSTLSPTLPKTAIVSLNQETGIVTEDEISYDIELWHK